MVGRRRRAPSDSTVATIDESAIQYFKEDSVLKPASTRMHTDDWPCFLLTNATIYHKDGTLANLLHVDLEGPLIVRGQLEIDKDQEGFLVNRHIKGISPWIQIQNTQSFSIGLKDDGLPMPVVWASGKAGWYEIVPSDTYMPICDTMFQGISLHYAVLDEYETALEKLHLKKKNRHKTLGDVELDLPHVFFKYALTVGDGVTLPEVLQQIKDQAVFLLSHFPKDTKFYRWLVEQYPDIAQKLRSKESNDPKKATTPDSESLIAIPYRSVEKSASAEIVDNKNKGKAVLRNPTSRALLNGEAVKPETSESSDNEHYRKLESAKGKQKLSTDIPFESSHSPDVIMLDVPDQHDDSTRGSTKERNSIRASIETNATRPDSYHAGGSRTDTHSPTNASVAAILGALQDTRRELLGAMSEGKKHPDEMSASGWLTRLYRELSISNHRAPPEICQYYARDLVQLLGPEWRRTLFYKWLLENIDTQPQFQEISEDAVKKIVRRKKKAKPSHEKVPSPLGGKENVRTAGKGPPAERGSRHSAIGGLRLSTGSGKRFRYEENLKDDGMELDDDGLSKTVKKARYLTEEEQSGEAQDSISPSDEDEGEDNKDATLAKILLRAEKLPSTTPNGPNQTWVCEEPGCDYVVRAADQEHGQAQISKHFEAHEKDIQGEIEQIRLKRQNLMDLALQESEIGQNPINHLLEKIRRLGNKTQKRDEVQLNGQTVQKPIKHGLLI